MNEYPKTYRCYNNFGFKYKVLVTHDIYNTVEYCFDNGLTWLDSFKEYIVIDCHSGQIVQEKYSFRLIIKLINQDFFKLPFEIQRQRAPFIATMDDLKSATRAEGLTQ